MATPDEIITAAMLLGCEFKSVATVGLRGRRGEEWVAGSAAGQTTGRYIHKADAAAKYLLQRGFQLDVDGNLMEQDANRALIAARRRAFLNE